MARGPIRATGRATGPRPENARPMPEGPHPYGTARPPRAMRSVATQPDPS